MKSFLSKIKSGLQNLFTTRPMRILVGVGYGVGALLLATTFMNALTQAVTAFKGLSKAVLS